MKNLLSLAVFMLIFWALIFAAIPVVAALVFWVRLCFRFIA